MGNRLWADAQRALSEVAEKEDRGEALAALTKRSDVMAGLAHWSKKDEVGYQAALTGLARGPNGVRLSNKVIDAFHRTVDEIAQGLSRKNLQMPALLKSLLPHPNGDELLVPAGYTLDLSGTYQLRPTRGGTAPTRERVCHYPMILEGYVRDVETGSSLVVVAWFANQEWRRMVISRESMAVGSDFARAAAPFGAPIHSANASYVILYLSAFEAANISKFETVRGVSRMGWLPGQEAFLVGPCLVTNQGQRQVQSPQTLAAGWTDTDFVFVPSGQEVHRILSGYRQAGTLADWGKAACIASNYPLALAGLYVSLLPPLMQILGADNFVWEWSGKSSVGKTTALSLAASVWGQPKLNLDPSIVSSWRVTDVYIERMLATLGDLPFFLDDTRTATRGKFAIDPAQVVYDVVSGTTKGRGTLASTEARRAWRTILMSTGEEPITGETTKLGVHARTWAIFGQPWGRTDPEAAAMVFQLENLFTENYGIVGPLWVQRIIEKRESWPKWKELYRQMRDDYGTKGAIGDNAGLAGRLGKNVAAIEMCANIAQNLIPEVFTWSFKTMLEELWAWAQNDGSGADPTYDAIIAVRNWCFANAEKFYPRGSVEPAGGWMGIWPLPRKDMLVPSIYLRPDLLMAQVKGLGHANFRVLLDEWDRKGWLRGGGRKSKKGSPMIFLRRAVRLHNVEMTAIELRPPVEAAETLEAYDSLSEHAFEQLQ